MTKGSHVAILPGFWSEIEGNGQDCAIAIAEDYFTHDERWDEWFGEDYNEAIVMVEILEPAANKGIYEVCMECVIKATAAPVKDPRP